MKTFNEPTINIFEMNAEDVITTSNPNDNGDNNTGDQEL